MENKLFWDNYAKWQKQVEEEFKASEFWHNEYENAFEITESGDVYLGGMQWIYGVVTSWEDSEFYVD